MYGIIGTAILGGATYYYSGRRGEINSAVRDAKVKAEEAVTAGKAKVESATGKAAFTGGDQGFISLKLESIENVNHNTKKFRFALPEEDQVSGLKVASALLTKYKGPNMEKPAIRPYTPVSDESMCIFPTLPTQLML